MGSPGREELGDEFLDSALAQRVKDRNDRQLGSECHTEKLPRASLAQMAPRQLNRLKLP